MAYSKQWEDCKQRAKTYPMKQLLQHLGIEFGKYNKVSCPFHNEKTPSASIGNQNVLNCFACGATRKNNIDVYMEVMGVNFKDAVNAINALEGVVLPDRKVIVEQIKKRPPVDPQISYQNFIAGFLGYKLLSKEKRAKVDTFLTEKHLEQAVEILHKNELDIGLDRYNNIAFNLNGFGIVRRENKENRGTPKPTLLKVNSTPTWFIVEGITDAIVACMLGFNAVSMNSTNNIDTLLENLSKSQKSKSKNYIICTDQDAAGIKAREKLEDFFVKENYSYNICNALYASNSNDLNDWYITNKDNLRDYFAIRALLKDNPGSGTIFGI